MSIVKNLKFASFEWDEEKQLFTITNAEGEKISLNKTYSFAFTRFFVRVAQKNWLRSKPANANKKNQPSIEVVEDLDMNSQMALFEPHE